MLSPDVPALAAAWQRRALATLWRMGVPARAGRLRRSAAAVTLEVVPNRPESMRAVLRSSEALQAALGVPRPVVVRQSGRLALVDVPLPSGMARAATLASMGAGVALAMPLGRGDDGRPVVVDLGNPATPHGLVTGATGSGKSNAVRFMLRQLIAAAADGLAVVLCDPDGATFPGLPVASDPPEVLQALRWAAAEVQRRAADDTRVMCGPVVIIVDEAQAVLQVDGARVALETITARGRKHRVHAILATSDPTGGAIPRSIAQNLRFRLAGGVVDFHASMAALGAAGAERLRQPGSMILQPGGRRLTVPRVDLADVAELASSGAIAAPWAAVPEGIPACPEGIPRDAWAWLLGSVRDAGKTPGIGAIAARFKVGKTRAAAWRAMLGTVDVGQDLGKGGAENAPIPASVPEVLQ